MSLEAWSFLLLLRLGPVLATGLAVLPTAIAAEAPVRFERNLPDEATADFSFPGLAPPLKQDAGSKATFKVIAGQPDPNSGGLGTLNDGAGPIEEDQPRANFFFAPGSEDGRLRADLGQTMSIQEVRTFSWHPGDRGPQVYALYGADGSAPGFEPEPGSQLDPGRCGWTFIAKVDTRGEREDAPSGGQYAACVGNSTSPIGRYRFLLFCTAKTRPGEAFANTFWGEIDLVEQGAAEEPRNVRPRPEPVKVFDTDAGSIRVDTSAAPDLTGWARDEAGAMAAAWYPRLARLLATEGSKAPRSVTIRFLEMDVVADTSGARIRCGAPWFRQNLNAEGLGAVFHELVHVVQQYDRARVQPGATAPPGWLVEGIADYYRWYVFQPEMRGAEISSERAGEARFDAGYRPSANFLNWVGKQHGTDLVPKMNAVIRQGRYRDELWKDWTGHALSELGGQWKGALVQQ